MNEPLTKVLEVAEVEEELRLRRMQLPFSEGDEAIVAMEGHEYLWCKGVVTRIMFDRILLWSEENPEWKPTNERFNPVPMYFARKKAVSIREVPMFDDGSCQYITRTFYELLITYAPPFHAKHPLNPAEPVSVILMASCVGGVEECKKFLNKSKMWGKADIEAGQNRLF